ncbi:MAG: cobalamin adenosyltransferase [Clostridioides sp.]|jgi:ethanolamine utilization cobalamin adenosyltransferase|nr:cobalamin adenosyltransferase [Clostridioides sp.]
MKFITEQYLRDLYKKDPFDNYKLDPEQRLTPGARQYLSDKGIRMQDDNFAKYKKVSATKVETSRNEQKNSSSGGKQEDKRSKKSIRKISLKFKNLESKFLLTAQSILTEDILVAQEVITLTHKLASIQKFIEGRGDLEEVELRPCTGITAENFNEDIGDCFEITEFHIQLTKGAQIAKLYALKCELEETAIEVEEIQDRENHLDKIVKNTNAIANTLSQMICRAVGGTVCQRKK